MFLVINSYSTFIIIQTLKKVHLFEGKKKKKIKVEDQKFSP